MLARPNQPPVPSVAHTEEVTTDAWVRKSEHDNPLNEVCEAYTGNAMGHKSVRTALESTNSLDSDDKAEGDGFFVPEANKKEPLW